VGLSPAAHGPFFEEAEQGIRRLAKDCQQHNGQDDAVGASVILRVEQQEAEPLRRGEQFCGDQKEPRLREGESESGDHSGQDCRQLNCSKECDPREAKRAPGFDELAIDVPQRCCDCCVHGEEGADGDEGEFGFFADFEPQQEQGHPRERGHSTDSAKGGSEKLLPDSGKPDDGAKDEAQSRADGETDEHALEGDSDEGAEQTAFREVDTREVHHLG